MHSEMNAMANTNQLYSTAQMQGEHRRKLPWQTVPENHPHLFSMGNTLSNTISNRLFQQHSNPFNGTHMRGISLHSFYGRPGNVNVSVYHLSMRTYMYKTCGATLASGMHVELYEWNHPAGALHRPQELSQAPCVVGKITGISQLSATWVTFSIWDPVASQMAYLIVPKGLTYISTIAYATYCILSRLNIRAPPFDIEANMEAVTRTVDAICMTIRGQVRAAEGAPSSQPV